ncbi:MAG TPA: tetratricopeptide repeat protein [Aquabacterium sp.]|nr:tetratricopeptide repeat protein [Aquabacterium sp.]
MNSAVSSGLARSIWRAAALACLAMQLVAGQAPAAAQPVVGAAEIERQYRSGEAQMALQRLEQALAQRPGDAPLRFLQAVLVGEAGRPAESRRLLERMTQEFPDLPEPYNNLAVLHAADGQLDQARGLLETALRLDPAYRVAHENLGDVFVRLAQRAYEAASGPRAGPGLAPKLRLVRELSALR